VVNLTGTPYPLRCRASSASFREYSTLRLLTGTSPCGRMGANLAEEPPPLVTVDCPCSGVSAIRATRSSGSIWPGQCQTARLEGGMEDLVAKRYEKDPSVVYREIAGEAILVPIRRNISDMESIYTLDEVGADIWALIDGERTAGEIQDLLLGEYEVDAEVLSIDLAEFIQQLLSIGAIRTL